MPTASRLTCGALALLVSISACSSSHPSGTKTTPTTANPTNSSSSTQSTTTSVAGTQASSGTQMEIETASALIVVSAGSPQCSLSGGKLSASVSGTGYQTGQSPQSAAFTLNIPAYTASGYLTLTQQNSSGTLTIGGSSYSGYSGGTLLVSSGKTSLHANFTNPTATVITVVTCA